MKIVILGTGGAGGPPGRAKSSIVFETENTRLLVDFGEGCSSRLEALGYTLSDFDLVYITHLHPDHYSGLHDASVLALLRGNVGFRLGGTGRVYDDLDHIINMLPRTIRDSVVKVNISYNGLKLGDLWIKPIRVEHIVETYGLIVEHEGTKVLYTSDTRPCSSVLDLARTSDVVIHEVTLPSSLEHESTKCGHTSVNQVLELRRLMKEHALLILTHLTVNSERELFSLRRLPRNTIIPYDLTCFNI